MAGRGVEINIKRAIQLYRRAAIGRQVESFLNLGQIYDEGNHVAQDDIESFKWFAKAAECGDARGEYRIGLMYYDGIGVERDLGRSLTLLTCAKAKGITVQEEILLSLANLVVDLKS